MPAVSTNSNGVNVVMSDDEATREALQALRACGRELDHYEASGQRDQASARMAANLFHYAERLIDQVNQRD